MWRRDSLLYYLFIYLFINQAFLSATYTMTSGQLNIVLVQTKIMMSRYRTWFLRRARLVRGWVIVTDRGLSHMHGFSGKIPRPVTLTYERPDDFCKVGTP